jgi:hypothetical protein
LNRAFSGHDIVPSILLDASAFTLIVAGASAGILEHYFSFFGRPAVVAVRDGSFLGLALHTVVTLHESPLAIMGSVLPKTWPNVRQGHEH